MISFLIGIIGFLLIMFAGFKVIGKIWHKMHDIVGIEVGQSRHTPQLGYEPPTTLPNTFGSDNSLQLINQQNSNNKQWQTRHGKLPAMLQLVGITEDKLNLMPTEAVVILDRINGKMVRYTAWQQENQLEQTQWLTEKQFVLNRLISQTIPEAVNQYDQLARFNPYHLQQKIHDNLTAGDMLIAVLLEVDKQIDELINELHQQVTNQLATTYRYIKSRTQS